MADKVRERDAIMRPPRLVCDLREGRPFLEGLAAASGIEGGRCMCERRKGEKQHFVERE